MERAGQQDRDALIAEIERAFDGVSRGNGITLHQARVIDDYGDEKEQAEARKKDVEARWQDIPDSLIERLADTLPFLDSEGFRYYIPAFMIWAVRHPESSCPAGDYAVYNLDFRIDDEATVLLLSSPQKAAIARFLQYTTATVIGGMIEAQKALRRCWDRFL